MAIFRALDNRAGEAKSLNDLGTASRALGDYGKARKYFEQSLEIARARGDRDEERITLGNLGDTDLEQGRFQEALASYSQVNDQIRFAIYRLRLGDFGSAREQFQKSLRIIETVRNSDSILVEYLGLGLTYEGLKNWKESLSYFQKAVDTIEAQRDKLDPAGRRQFLGYKLYTFERLDAYEGLARVALTNGDAALGLYWAEHTKARLFLEALARKESGRGLNLPERLENQENWIRTQLASLYKQQDAAFNAKNTVLFQSLLPKLAEAKREQEAFVARLRREQPAYAAVAYPQPLHLEDIKLQPNEVLLEYEVTDSATLAWLVKDGRLVKTLNIPVTREALNQQVRDYLRFFKITAKSQLADLARFDPKLGKALYDLLFKDFRPLIQDTDRLVLVPDDILASLPFEALVTEAPARTEWRNGPHGGGPQGVHYLGDTLGLRYVQSATALVQTRQFRRAASDSAKPLLVVADPVYGDPDDPRVKSSSPAAQLAQNDAAPEQRAISDWLQRSGETNPFERLETTSELSAKLLPLFGGTAAVETLTGFAANEVEAKRHLGLGYRYGVFATHGILANNLPYIQEPALVLSLVAPDGEKLASEKAGSPGFLTLTEVMSLRIDSDLMALTACKTGLGKDLPGEGVMGMGRAFQYAGVNSVLMSLWSVEDASTNLLTERFFLYLKQGKNKLESLRLARSDLGHEGYEHPYYWAPFILVGEL